jgi:hypothetical protein
LTASISYKRKEIGVMAEKIDADTASLTFFACTGPFKVIKAWNSLAGPCTVAFAAIVEGSTVEISLPAVNRELSLPFLISQASPNHSAITTASSGPRFYRSTSCVVYQLCVLSAF